MAKMARTGPGQTSNLELHPGLPYYCRGPRTWATLHCSSRCISRELDHKWSNQDSILVSQAVGILAVPHHQASPWPPITHCFIDLSTTGHTECIYVLAGATNTVGHPLDMLLPFPLTLYPVEEPADPIVILCLGFLRWSVLFYIFTNSVCEVSLSFSVSFPEFSISFFCLSMRTLWIEKLKPITDCDFHLYFSF